MEKTPRDEFAGIFILISAIIKLEHFVAAHESEKNSNCADLPRNTVNTVMIYEIINKLRAIKRRLYEQSSSQVEFKVSDSGKIKRTRSLRRSVISV